jgi:hypothetical protein
MIEEKYWVKNHENDTKNDSENEKMFLKLKPECYEFDDASTAHKDCPSNPETHAAVEEYIEAPLPLSKLESAPC